MLKNRTFLILASIFLLALFLRLFKLADVPHGFHSDELIAGYEGTYILKNGHDTYGKILPFYFDKFGDFRPTGVFYLVGVFNLIFGASVFATRFGVAVVGALTTFAVFYLFLELFGKKHIVGALSSAFILSILPWHIVLSRSTQESIVGTFTIGFGLVFLLKYLQDKLKKHLIISAVLLFLSYFFYTAHRLLIPLILIVLVWETAKVYKNRLGDVSKFAFAFVLLSVFVLATPWGRSRGTQVSIFSNPTPVIVGGNLSFGDGPGNVAIARLFHNKAVVYTRELGRQYLSYFSPEFLFVQGGPPDRYVVPEQGLLYFVLAPLLVTGFIVSVRRGSWFPIYLIIISPLVSFFTIDDIPNMNRVSFMVIPIALLTGLGIQKLVELKTKLLRFSILFVVLGMLLLEFIYFSHQYLVHESQHKSLYRNDSFAEVSEYLIENRDKYETILVSNTRDHMLVYYWFFAKDFSHNMTYEMNTFPDVTKYQNFVFVKDECASRRLDELTNGNNVLVLENGDCLSSGNFHQLEDWKRGDSTQAFRALVKREEQ